MSGRIYTASTGSNNVSVVDPALLQSIAVIDVTTIRPLGFAPLAVAASADGTRVYTANGSTSNVSVLDATNNTLLGVIDPIGGTSPLALATGPQAAIFVANGGSNNVGVLYQVTAITSGNWPTIREARLAGIGRLHGQMVLSGQTNTLSGTIPLLNGAQTPRGIASNQLGTQLYTADANGYVSVLDAVNKTFVRNVDVGQTTAPAAITANRSGTRVFVAGETNSEVLVMDLGVNPPSANSIKLPGGSDPVAIAGPRPIPSQFEPHAMLVPRLDLSPRPRVRQTLVCAGIFATNSWRAGETTATSSLPEQAT